MTMNTVLSSASCQRQPLPHVSNDSVEHRCQRLNRDGVHHIRVGRPVDHGSDCTSRSWRLALSFSLATEPLPPLGTSSLRSETTDLEGVICESSRFPSRSVRRTSPYQLSLPGPASHRTSPCQWDA